MKMCQKHWDQLVQAIKDRGLWHLVPQSGEAGMEAMISELNGEPRTAENYDPLGSANWMIVGRALKAGGLYLMGHQEDGSEYCPLCEVAKHAGEGTDTEWITGCTDSILKYCQDNGWTARPQ